jgi:hypothetical protein
MLRPILGSLLAVLTFASACRAAVPPRLVDIARVIVPDAGGDYTRAMVVVIEGKTVFLKSLRNRTFQMVRERGGRPEPTELTRYCNFEADILAHHLFSLVGVKSPGAAVVRLKPGTKAAQKLGEFVLAMEYVDTAFAGAPVQEGYWPGTAMVAVDAFIGMALVDILMGNADRRDPNFFITVGSDSLVHPIPIDNNAGLTTMLVWLIPSNLINFYPSYTGVGPVWPWNKAGTIANILFRGGEFHHVHEHLINDAKLRPRVLQVARTLVSRLTDALVNRLLDRLPPEIIPQEAMVDPQPMWLAAAGVAPSLFFGPATMPLFGRALYELRLREIKETLLWRRDHLVEALKDYWETRDSRERTSTSVK